MEGAGHGSSPTGKLIWNKHDENWVCSICFIFCEDESAKIAHEQTVCKFGTINEVQAFDKIKERCRYCHWKIPSLNELKFHLKKRQCTKLPYYTELNRGIDFTKKAEAKDGSSPTGKLIWNEHDNNWVCSICFMFCQDEPTRNAHEQTECAFQAEAVDECQAFDKINKRCRYCHRLVKTMDTMKSHFELRSCPKLPNWKKLDTYEGGIDIPTVQLEAGHGSSPTGKLIWNKHDENWVCSICFIFCGDEPAKRAHDQTVCKFGTIDEVQAFDKIKGRCRYCHWKMPSAHELKFHFKKQQCSKLPNYIKLNRGIDFTKKAEAKDGSSPTGKLIWNEHDNNWVCSICFVFCQDEPTRNAHEQTECAFQAEAVDECQAFDEINKRCRYCHMVVKTMDAMKSHFRVRNCPKLPNWKRLDTYEGGIDVPTVQLESDTQTKWKKFSRRGPTRPAPLLALIGASHMGQPVDQIVAGQNAQKPVQVLVRSLKAQQEAIQKSIPVKKYKKLNWLEEKKCWVCRECGKLCMSKIVCTKHEKLDCKVVPIQNPSWRLGWNEHSMSCRYCFQTFKKRKEVRLHLQRKMCPRLPNWGALLRGQSDSDLATGPPKINFPLGSSPMCGSPKISVPLGSSPMSGPPKISVPLDSSHMSGPPKISVPLDSSHMSGSEKMYWSEEKQGWECKDCLNLYKIKKHSRKHEKTDCKIKVLMCRCWSEGWDHQSMSCRFCSETFRLKGGFRRHILEKKCPKIPDWGAEYRRQPASQSATDPLQISFPLGSFPMGGPHEKFESVPEFGTGPVIPSNEERSGGSGGGGNAYLPATMKAPSVNELPTGHFQRNVEFGNDREKEQRENPQFCHQTITERNQSQMASNMMDHSHVENRNLGFPGPGLFGLLHETSFTRRPDNHSKQFNFGENHSFNQHEGRNDFHRYTSENRMNLGSHYGASSSIGPERLAFDWNTNEHDKRGMESYFSGHWTSKSSEQEYKSTFNRQGDKRGMEPDFSGRWTMNPSEREYRSTFDRQDDKRGMEPAFSGRWTMNPSEREYRSTFDRQDDQRSDRSRFHRNETSTSRTDHQSTFFNNMEMNPDRRNQQSVSNRSRSPVERREISGSYSGRDNYRPERNYPVHRPRPGDNWGSSEHLRTQGRGRPSHW